MYPAQIQCLAIDNLFIREHGFYKYDNYGEEGYYKFAQIDKQATLNAQGIGIYQCFCNKYKTYGSVTEPGTFCHDYLLGKTAIKYFSSIIAALIAVINISVRLLNMYLTNKVGYNYESQRVRMLMQCIIYSQYFNTSLMILLCNADFYHTPLHWIPKARGQFSDISINWYIMFAPALIKTSMFYAVFPYLNYLGFAFIRYFKRWRDSGFASFSFV